MNSKSREAAKRIAVMILAVLFLAYIVYQAYLVTHVAVDTEVATLTTVNETVDTEVFVVRNESYVKNSDQGTLIALADDGSRVGKGEGVAAVFADEEAAANYAELEALKDDIERYTRLSTQDTTYAVDVTTMNSQISSDIIDMVATVDSGDFSDLQDTVYDVRDALITKQIATGELDSLDSKIQTLNDEYNEASSKSSDHNTVVSKSSGYYVGSTDGYESFVDYDTVSSLTVSQIEDILDSKAETVADNVIGKVISDFDWYIICVIDTKDAGNLKEDKSITVNLPYSAVTSVPAVVESINNTNNDKKTAVVLRCNTMNSYIASLRKEDAEIVINTYEGLKNSNKAIQVNDDGEKGVYVKSGNVAEFKKLDIIYSTDDYVISAIEHQDTASGDYVSMYDDVIVGGKNLYDGKIID